MLQKYFNKCLLGIDINANALKIIECDHHRKIKSITAPFTDISSLTATLQSVLREHRIKTKRAVIAIPTSAVIFKTVTLPTVLTDEELEQHFALNVEQYLGQALSDIYLDYFYLPTSEKIPQVELIAARRATVDNLIAALSAAKIKIIAVDVEAMVLVRLAQFYALDGIWLHFDTQRVLIVAIVTGNLLYAHELPVTMIIEQLKHQLHWIKSMPAASIIINIYLLGNTEKITEYLPHLQNITTLALHFFNTEDLEDSHEWAMSYGMAIWPH